MKIADVFKNREGALYSSNMYHNVNVKYDPTAYVLGLYGGGSNTHVLPHLRVGQKVRDTVSGQEYRVAGCHRYDDSKTVDFVIFLIDGDYYAPSFRILPGKEEPIPENSICAIPVQDCKIRAKSMFNCPASIFFANYEKIDEELL